MRDLTDQEILEFVKENLVIVRYGEVAALSGIRCIVHGNIDGYVGGSITGYVGGDIHDNIFGHVGGSVHGNVYGNVGL